MITRRKRMITQSFVIGFCFVIIMFTFGGLAFLNEINALSHLTRSIYQHPLVVSNTALQCSLTITKMHRTMKDIVLFPDTVAVDHSVELINREETAVYKDLDLISRTILGDQGRALAREAHTLFRAWKPIRDEVIDLVRNHETRQAALITRGKGAQHVLKMEAKMYDLNRYAKDKATHFLDESDRTVTRIKFKTLALFTLFGGLVLLIGVITAVRSYKSEDELIRSEHRHRVIFENSPLGMIRFSPDGRIIDLNDQFVGLMGSSREKLIGFNTARDSEPKMRRALKKALLGEVSEYEDRYTSVTGGKSADIRVIFNPVNPGTHDTEVIATLEDVTVRNQAQKEIQDNEQRLKLILDSVQTGIMIVDENTHQILDINPTAAQMIGVSPEQIIGNDCRQFVCPACKGECPISDLGQKIDNSEQVLLAVSGEQIPVLKTVTRTVIKGRACLVECFADIRKQKETEEALTRAKDAAEEASRSKAAFLANMSHEIRTPMNGVIGMTELLLGTGLSAEQMDFATTIKTSGESLLAIINDILDFSKIEAGKMTLENIRFNVRTVLEEIADIFSLRAQEKNLEYVNIIRPGVPTFLLGDPQRLRQILVNLIGNAIKFTTQGEITIRVSRTGENKDQVTLKFSIEDTGIGIQKDTQAMLFESFSQEDTSTTRKYGGTGLGLSISKQLCELLGGDIGVTSTQGKGSTFWFTAAFGRLPDSFKQEVIPREDIRGKAILIADAHKTTRYVLKEDLKIWGCRYDDAKTGHEALEKLKTGQERGTPFDMVIIDKHMPDMDGDTLGKLIKADPGLHATTLIMLTAAAARGDARRIRQLGFAAYLKKPVKQSDLLECLRTAHHANTQTDQDAPAPGPLITTHSIAEGRDKGVRILLAEDNRINQKVAINHLKKLGYPADVVMNGKEAIKALEEAAYDLVLMDCMMPEMDGFEATANIRNSETVFDTDIPIIAMTANAMAGDREKCLACGMNDYLPKPVKPDDLRLMLERWLGSRDGSVITQDKS